MISASILGCDLLNIEFSLKKLIENDIKTLHFDVMDGHFVPNITFGKDLLKQIKQKYPQFFIQTHLMISNPEDHIQDFIDSGSDEIFFHLELDVDQNKIFQIARQHNIKIGVSINPKTPISFLNPILTKIDSILIMTVNPGKCGQEFIENGTERIRQIKDLCKNQNIKISVDGGVNSTNAQNIYSAGADILVSGSFLFKNINNKEMISTLIKNV